MKKILQNKTSNRAKPFNQCTSAELKSRNLAFNLKKNVMDKFGKTNETCAAGNKIKRQNQKLRYKEKQDDSSIL